MGPWFTWFSGLAVHRCRPEVGIFHNEPVALVSMTVSWQLSNRTRQICHVRCWLDNAYLNLLLVYSEALLGLHALGGLLADEVTLGLQVAHG